MPDPTDPRINPEARLQETVNPKDPPSYDAKAMWLIAKGYAEAARAESYDDRRRFPHPSA